MFSVDHLQTAAKDYFQRGREAKDFQTFTSFSRAARVSLDVIYQVLVAHLRVNLIVLIRFWRGS